MNYPRTPVNSPTNKNYRMSYENQSILDFILNDMVDKAINEGIKIKQQKEQKRQKRQKQQKDNIYIHATNIRKDEFKAVHYS